MRRNVTLMAGKFRSRNFGTKPYLADALRSTGNPKPHVMYIGVASGDNRAFGTMLKAVIKLSGARKVDWPHLAGRKAETAKARELLQQVDLVFIGGGDVEVGIERLRELDLKRDLVAAADRGAIFCAMSAGAIMLGERWIRWPSEHAGDDSAETYECLGLVPFSLDTHGEGDEWQETHSFATVRAREIQPEAHAYGTPPGGALLVPPDGKAKALGVAAPMFVAQPGKKARLGHTLKAVS